MTVFRPDTIGPHGLVIFSHGSPRSKAEARTHGRVRLVEQSEWFVQRGFVVGLPMRRGYGTSDDPIAEQIECDSPDYVRAVNATADDILAAVDYFASDRSVDRARMLLVGHSAGGLGSLAAASRLEPPPMGVVNISGGRGSEADRENCSRPRLVEAVASFARNTVPSLWLYAENDQFFWPELVTEMHEAFRRAGGHSVLEFTAPFEPLGHALFWSRQSAELWIPSVANFIRSLNAEQVDSPSRTQLTAEPADRAQVD